MTYGWVFDPTPASGARFGGLAQAEVFDKDIDTFVREVLQNALDQRRPDAGLVRVALTLEELSGPALEEFMAGALWQGLLPHLDATAEMDYVTISPRVRQGLDGLRSRAALRILRIEDFGTYGLTGEEDEPEGNFNALCRHTLITSGSRRESGGSFGLGKSVLWRFSEFSTVLFHSIVAEPSPRSRFFGRCQLAYHRTADGEWDGSGWVGLVEQRPAGRRAVSVWDSVASRAAELTGMARDPLEPGTTITIVGFDDPAIENEPSVDEHCSNFYDSAARWFWPALIAGTLEVVIEGRVGGQQSFHRVVRATDEVGPFVAAEALTSGPSDSIASEGDVVEIPVTFDVPAQRATAFPRPRLPMRATGRLRLRLSETGEDRLQGMVALRRGTGMVVRYWPPPKRFGIDRAFHAVFSVGRAIGESPSDHAAEEFLRAAEPVAHNEWTGTTDRIKAEYVGGGRAIDALHAAISQAIADALVEPPSVNREGPDALRRMFPIPRSGGGSVSREPFRLNHATAQYSGDSWSFSGEFSRSRVDDMPWRFSVRLGLDQESGATGEALPLDELVVDGTSVAEHDGERWVVTVPANVARVRFTGRSRPRSVGADLSRVRVVLDVRPLSWPSA